MGKAPNMHLNLQAYFFLLYSFYNFYSNFYKKGDGGAQSFSAGKQPISVTAC